MGVTERNVGGRVQTFRFTTPEDTRPARLQGGLRRIGELWQEWEHGIGGCLPAKTFRKDTSRLSSGDNNKFSRRKPVYLLLESLIHHKKCVPAEAFRLVEDAFGKLTMTKLGDEIRSGVNRGTLPPSLCVPTYKCDLQAPRYKRRRDEI